MQIIPEKKDQLVVSCAKFWFYTRDVKHLVEKYLQRYEEKIFTLLMKLCSVIFKLYGYEYWVVFLSDLFGFDDGLRKPIQKGIDNTFFNLITGWKGSGKHHIITSPQELEEKIIYLVVNTSLKEPNFEAIYKQLLGKIKERDISRKEWARIRNTLVNLHEHVIVYYELRNAMRKLDRKILPSIRIAQDKEIEERVNYRKLKKQLHKFTLESRDEKIDDYLVILSIVLKKEEIKDIMFLVSALSYLFGMKFKQNEHIVKLFLENANWGFKNLIKKELVCQITLIIASFDFNQLLREKKYSDAIKILEEINQRRVIKYYKKNQNVIKMFLAESYLELTYILLKRNIYGRAEKNLKEANSILSSMKGSRDEKLQKLKNSNISLREELQNVEIEMLFILDTSLLCGILDTHQDYEYELKLILNVLNSYDQIDYNIPIAVWDEIPAKYKNRTPSLQDILIFKEYEITDERINELIILNEIRISRFFDEEEIIDYKIIQTALDHRTDDIISIIVSNDEGIHKFINRAIQEQNIRSIWSHTFLSFLANNENSKKQRKKLNNLAKDIKEHIEDYRKRNQRGEIYLNPFDETLLSVKLRE